MGNTDPGHGALIIAGPTASGKSALAAALAEAVGAVIINADSMQVYRELRIMTARPTREEERRQPHRLYGIRSIAEPSSAALWRRMALAEIEMARADSARPIIVGGTGLYLRALTRGLAAIPDIPTEVRKAARDLHERIGGVAMHAMLRARDPETARRLRAEDRQRLIRAHEVLEATGTPLSVWQARDAAGADEIRAGGIRANGFGPHGFRAVILEPPRAQLYARCEARLDAMIAAGGLREVAWLAASEHAPDLPGMKAVGLPELRRHLAGALTLSEALAAAKQATRRYAKRQATWFRHQAAKDLDIGLTISEQLSDKNLSCYVRKIRKTVLT